MAQSNVWRSLWILVGVVFGFIFFGKIVFANTVDQDGPRCNLTKSYSDIIQELKTTGSDEDKKNDSNRFLNHEQVFRFFHDGEDGYVMSYAYQLTNKFDAPLVLGIFTSANEHAGDNGLGGFIKQSKVLSENEFANPYRVFYEQDVDWMDNGKYTVENVLHGFATKDSVKSWMHRSTLLESSGAKFSPKWMSAYLRVDELKTHEVLVVACNYMRPRSDWFQDRFNSTAMSRFKTSGNKLNAWIDRVSQDSELAEQYRNRFNRLTGR